MNSVLTQSRLWCRAAISANVSLLSCFLSWGSIPASAQTSPFYDFTVIAEEGEATPAGEVLGDIEANVSVNDLGQVAFIGSVDDIEQVFVGNLTRAPLNVSQTPRTTNMDFPQINNRGLVVERELWSGNGAIQLWDVRNPGTAFLLVADTFRMGLTQLTLPVLGNGDLTRADIAPLVGYLGRESDLPFAYRVNDKGTRLTQTPVSQYGNTLASFRSMAADGEWRTIVLQRQFRNSPRTIEVRQDHSPGGSDDIWEPTMIATTALGRYRDLGFSPAISDTGYAIAFLADDEDAGPGLYLAVSDERFANEPDRIDRVWDLDDVVGCDENGAPITFAEFDFEKNALGIIHQEFPPLDSFHNDRFVIVFGATPERASIENSADPSRPLWFSEHPGIWTLQVDYLRMLDDEPNPRLRPHVASPTPVVQLGDVIGGRTVNDFMLYDPISIPLHDPAGVARPGGAAPGDHYVAFTIETAFGTHVVRAAKLDTDQDGLMDHWETRGLDMDGDGNPELDLPKMQANPLRRDVYVEIDWLNERRSGVSNWWSCRPAPGVIGRLVEMFNPPNTPGNLGGDEIANPDGSRGITLHVDAGPLLDDFGDPYSYNMGDDLYLLDGGQEITKGGNPDKHIDVVYFGLPKQQVEGVVSESLHELKKLYFGKKDKRAREFVFKYVVFADFKQWVERDDSDPSAFIGRVGVASEQALISADELPEAAWRGIALKIVRGPGTGQVRRVSAVTGSIIRLREPWDFLPTAESWFALLDGNAYGEAEVDWYPRPDNNGMPGNDVIVAFAGYGAHPFQSHLATGSVQWRTLAHELGHTLTLRHGGNDHLPYWGQQYVSLMSYSHLDRELNTDPLEFGPQSSNTVNILPAGSTYPIIESYSDRTDPSGFSDWSNIRYDIFRSGPFLGNSFQKPSFPFEVELPPIEEWEPLDTTPPLVEITSPSGNGCGFSVAADGNLAVSVVATDDVQLKYVLVQFDINGDGNFSGEGERQVAEWDDATRRFKVLFENLSGLPGSREIIAMAYDSSFNIGYAVEHLTTGSESEGTITLLNQESTFPFQPHENAGGARQKSEFTLTAPSSGRIAFTVTSTPAIRFDTVQGDRHESTAARLFYVGKQIGLRPACNPPGCDPAVCTSYWNVPTGGGEIRVEVLGPATYDTDGFFLGHEAQNFTIKAQFVAVDVTPPNIEIKLPAVDDFVEVGGALVVDLVVEEDFGVASVVVSFDRNGDGDEDDPGESAVATDGGGGKFRAAFPGISGEAGARAIRVKAVDTSGYQSTKTGSVDVRLPDTTAPVVEIKSPPPGWPVRFDETLMVEVSAFDDVEMGTVTVSFDIDGDGNVSREGETMQVPRSGPNLYTVEFAGVAGDAGSRQVTVSAVDTAGNVAPASVPVTVGGITFIKETLFTDPEGAIPGQGSVWVGGVRQVIDYEPITVPGSGTVMFRVTAMPNVRQEVKNIQREDPYVRNITFNGTALDLRGSLACNSFGSNPAVCETSFAAEEGGKLDFSVLGPGTWNIWGEFSGHGEQTYVLEVEFTAFDKTAPDAAFIRPALGENLDLGKPLEARFDVSDTVGVASVVAVFDVDGDGDTNDYGEQLAALHVGGNTYVATFGAISGIPGPRALKLLATDTSLNTGTRSITVGVGGVGGGESVLFARSGIIPGQPSDLNGGSRQVVPFSGITVPGMGRITFRVEATPPRRFAVTNLERHDPMVVKAAFNGEIISLPAECNAPGSDPAVCITTWDSPASGNMDFEILGPAEYNIWGEFQGHGATSYSVDVLFRPGPVVTAVSPASGSVGGHTPVTVRGSGFGLSAVVLFDEVPATEVQWISAEELRCKTPPGMSGPADVRVLNSDSESRPWNYGAPYGLFGTANGAFIYSAAPAPGALEPEQLLGTLTGHFQAVGKEEAQHSTNGSFDIPGAGQLRFETYGFVPILGAIPGPSDDPEDLDWHNQSTSVRGFRDGAGTGYGVNVECSTLNAPYGPVVCNSSHVVLAAASGAGQFTVTGPARWNAFWRQFGDFVMESAPAQNWSVAVWFADQPTITSVSPSEVPAAGGTRVTLRGTHFAEGMSVEFGGVRASGLNILNSSVAACTVPGHKPGMVDVELKLLGMTSKLPGGFTYEGTANPDEDTDGDGLDNLMELYMGLNPQVRDSSGAYEVGSSNGFLRFVYRRARDTSGAVGVVEYSPDLKSWSTTEVIETVVRDLPDEDYVLVEARVIRLLKSGAYLRLRVTQ
ncbi:MAG: IPT/TIG domain-containing protein [Verrucomicrobiae bacterium]|nr:IPT/TIG domain-containing protein [Verrucomicrobiae bacterium]